MKDSSRDVWNAALAELQGEFSRRNYQTWLTKIFGLADYGSLFVVGVPNMFVAEYLERNQRSLIEQLLTRLTGHELQVFFCVAAP